MDDIARLRLTPAKILGALIAIVFGCLAVPIAHGQAPSMRLVLHSSTIIIQGLAPGPVRIEVERGGKRVAFALGTARSSSDLALVLELPVPADDVRNVVLPGDRVTLTVPTTTVSAVVPSIVADMDADRDLIAAIVPSKLDATVVIHDEAGRTVFQESLPAGATLPRVLTPSVDLNDRHAGYVDVSATDDVTVRSRFAPIQLDVDVANGLIHGSSSPGAWLTVTGRDVDGRTKRHLLQDGLYDNPEAMVGGAEWTVRLATAGDPEGAFRIAGATITVRREDLIVPGARPERAYVVPGITVSGPTGTTRRISGAAKPSTEVMLVQQPLFGSESESRVNAGPDGTWNTEVPLRPGDRASVKLTAPDGQKVTYLVAPSHAFVVPGTPSMMFVSDAVLRAGARLRDADDQALATLQADLGDGWGRSGFVAGRNAFDVASGMRVQLDWAGTLADPTTIPAMTVTLSESGARLSGELWPAATATVYQWRDGSTVAVADVTSDAAGGFSVPLVGSTFTHDVRGAVVVHVSDQLSLMAGWSRPEPMVDMFDHAVQMLAPVAAVHSFNLVTMRDGRHYEVVATAMPPRGTSARQWLSPTRLPLRTVTVQFTDADGQPVNLQAGDRITLPDDAIEIVLKTVRATLGPDGQVEVFAEGSDRVEVVLMGQSEELARRLAAPVETAGQFEADIADLLALHPADAVFVEGFYPRARLRSIAWKDSVEIGLHSGQVRGVALPGSTVRITVSRDGAEVAAVKTQADSVGRLAGWLVDSGGSVVAPTAGMSLTASFEGVRNPNVLSFTVPELTASILPGSDLVSGMGPANAELDVSAAYERGRVVFGRLAGVADAGGGGRATASVGPSGSYEVVLGTVSAAPFRAGPGVRLTVTYAALPGVSFYREVSLPLLGIEVDGSRVRLVGDAREEASFELREGPSSPVLASASGTTDSEGYVEAQWSGGRSDARSRPGSLVRLAGAGTVGETVLPVHIEADWEGNALRVVAPNGMPVHSASGRCVPWLERQAGLEPVPGADSGSNVIPIRGEPQPGQWYVGGVFGSAGHLLFDKAIRPLLVVDAAPGVVRGCASPYTPVNLRIRDEGGETWATGQGVTDSGGWYEIAVQREGRSAPIRRTDSVEATIEGITVEHSAREPFEIEIVDDVARVSATPGQTVVVVADVGAGYRERLATTLLESSGTADLALIPDVWNEPVRRWLIMVESAEDDGHFAGTVVERHLPVWHALLPFALRK